MAQQLVGPPFQTPMFTGGGFPPLTLTPDSINLGLPMAGPRPEDGAPGVPAEGASGAHDPNVPFAGSAGMPVLTIPWVLFFMELANWRKDIENLQGTLAALATPWRAPRFSAALLQALKISAAVTTVANTVVDTTLNSYSFAAGSVRVGQLFRIKVAGLYSTANAVDTATVNFKFPGTIHSLGTLAGTVTNAAWAAEWIVICTAAGAGGSIETSVQYFIRNTTISPIGGSGNVGLNTAIANTLAISVQWSNALPGNSFTIRQFSVEALAVS